MELSLPFVVFTALMVAMLVAMFWGAFEDPLPQRSSCTWAVTCPLAGLLYGIGLAPLAIISGAVSVLALGSLAYWFMVTEADDTDDDVEEVVEPDPGPSDDIVLEVPQEAPAEPEFAIDWDAFDRARADWEKQPAPEPADEPLPERV